MLDFELLLPTKIYFGHGKEQLIGEILKERKAQKVLIVIGSGSVKKTGLLDLVIEKLKENNISFEILEGVRANPTRQLAEQGVALAKEYHPDYVLAIGGGSVMDTAKFICAGYYSFHDLHRHASVSLCKIFRLYSSSSHCFRNWIYYIRYSYL